MISLSFPRATQIVQSITGQEELQDRDDEVNELPSNLTQIRLYRQWPWSQGHTTEISLSVECCVALDHRRILQKIVNGI
jgi:hypothetical protein